MKVTTRRAFRRQHLMRYRASDFDCYDDYFMYLHLNSQVQRLHVFGGLLGLALFPWAVWALLSQGDWLPSLLYLGVYYGTGLLSHWLGDGRFPQSAKDAGNAYLSVVRLIWQCLNGSIRAREAAFIRQYPQTLWVYLSDAPAPLVSTSLLSDSPA